MNSPASTRQFDFDREFQFRLLCLLTTDPSITPSWKTVVRPQYFVDKDAEAYCRLVYSYWDQYHQLPTRAVVNNMVSHTVKKDDQVNLHRWADAVFECNVPEKDYILAEVKKFTRVQEMTLAVLRAADLISHSGDVSKIPDIIQEAQVRLAMTLKDDGIHAIGMTNEERYNRVFLAPPRDCVPTYWASVNQFTGGPAKKELTVIAAPPNRGKSWLLANIGAAGVASGKYVLFVSLEMSDVLSAFRIYSILSGYTDKELKANPSVLDQVIPNYEKLGGEIVIKQYPTNAAGVNDLRDYIVRTATHENRMPDMVVVDYADLLAPPEGDDDKQHRFILSNIYRELRRIAIEYNLAMVTASQTNKSSLSVETITMGNLAECFDKASIADVIWAMCQTGDEEQANQARLFLAKNRNEVKGATIPLQLDFARGRMDERRTTINSAPSKGQGFIPGTQIPTNTF